MRLIYLILISTVFILVIAVLWLLNTPIPYKLLAKPQHGNLTLTVVPEKTRINEGEAFDIEIILRNHGRNAIDVWKPEWLVDYDIAFYYLNGTPVPKYLCPAIQRFQMTDKNLIELKPGESLKFVLKADAWRNCWILKEGEYILRVVYFTGNPENERITKPYWVGRVFNETRVRVESLRRADTENSAPKEGKLKVVLPEILPPDYNLRYDEIEGNLILYKVFQNGTKIRLDFPSDLFEIVGRNFEYRDDYEKREMVFNVSPDKVAWNGRHFLMDNGHSLIKYDGENFSILRYCEGYVCDIKVEKIVPGSRYWVIVYMLSGSPLNSISIVDGEKLEIISSFTYLTYHSVVIDTSRGYPKVELRE